MQKLALIPAFLVFLSGYGPLGLIFAAKDLDVSKAPYFHHPVLLLILLLAFLFSIAFTRWHFKKYSNDEPLKVIEIEDRSGDLISYSIPYIAGFSGIAIGDVGEMLAVIIVLGVVFHATYSTQSVVINPMLATLGYRMSTARLEYRGGRAVKATILSNEPLDVGESYRLRKISDFCFIHTKENNT